MINNGSTRAINSFIYIYTPINEDFNIRRVVSEIFN